MINQTLNNRYHITALLGKGAMGEVYRATDTQTGQDVAVKVLTQDLAFDQEMLERFRREGEALRRLRHPNIVGFVDTFQFEGHQAIVMEYVPGGNLHALIKKGPLPLDRVHQIALDLCDALTRAHRVNIIHRDIKPENVLIAEDGTPKLTDFGVARLLGETARITSTGALVGTPYYMSPEAWQGKTLDEQTDIWSLGVVLYEMLSGRVPFAGETLPAVMNKVLTEPPPDLKALRPDAPPALVNLIQRMLTRDKAKRYASIREVALDLELAMKEGSRSQAIRDTTIRDNEPTSNARGTLPVGAVVALGTLLVVGLLALGGLGAWAVAGKYYASAAARAATQPLILTPTGGPSSLSPTSETATPVPLQNTLAATATPVPVQDTAPATATPIPATETNAPAIPVSGYKLGRILFQTNFEDGTLNGFSHADGWWKVIQDETGNHVLDQDNRKGRNHWNRILFGDMSWRNYAVECRMRFVDTDASDNEWTHAGVDVRYEDLDVLAGQYNSFMTIRGTNIGIGYGNDRTSTYLNLAQSSDGYVVMGQWYKLRLEAIGDSYKFFIDDSEVLEATDSTSLSGPAGFHVGPAIHVQFDDVRVTEILQSADNTPISTTPPSATPVMVNTLAPTTTKKLPAQATMAPPTSSASTVAAIVGTWSGTEMVTWNGGTPGPWQGDIIATIPASCQVGSACGTLNFPTVTCSAQLSLVSISNNTFDFRRSSVTGNACFPNVADSLQVRPDGTLLYFGQEPGVSGTAVLHKTGNP